MDDVQDSTSQKSSSEVWREVGAQFEALGKSLSAAFRQAWNDEAGREAVQEVEAGLKSISRAVADTVDGVAQSSEGQQLRAEAERIAQSAHEAGKQVVAEVRPQLLAALKSVQQGLQSAISELQGKRAETEDETPGT